jgi:nucleotide-binding universal stress UspA family protein
MGISHFHGAPRENGRYPVVDPCHFATLTWDDEFAPHSLGEKTERMIDVAESYLADLQSALCETGVEVQVHVETGPVVRRILDVAAREEVNLIAMTSHGRTGLARVFYGSVAAGVLHQADRPLLLVRALDDE